MRRTFLKSLAALAVSAAFSAPVLAANPVEISFYYPVAVGGAVTKTIDSMVADFEKANPDVKVKAIYAGTYQESIVKALTAFKGGTPPTLAVLLSTDLFTLIDENAIVPIDSLANSAEDKKWIDGFYKGFMENSQTEGKTWGIPFQRSTIVMYYNKTLFKEAGLNPEKAPATWNEMVEAAKKLTKRDAAGNVSQWGVKIPSTGFGYWMFQAMTASNDTILMNSAGTKTYFDKPGACRPCSTGSTWPPRQGDAGRRHRMGHHAQGLPGAEGRHGLDHHRQPDQYPHQRQLPLRRGDAAGHQASGQPHRRRQLLRLQQDLPGRAAGGDEVHPLRHRTGARGPVVDRHRLRGTAPGRLGYAGNEEIPAGRPGRRRRPRTDEVRRGRTLHP
jgi:sn-glycerol 3-phosphate transport system substrate-binding protein